MRILLYCNGGTRIGVGHVVRVLALAEEAARSGHDLSIVGELDGPLVDALVRASPVEVRRTERGDLDSLLSVAAEVEPEVLHLDSYDHLPSSWPSAPLLSNIEDGTFGRRPADLGIDPNLDAETGPRPMPQPRVLLRGARYALLRTLVTSRRGVWELRPDGRRVLVVMGGSDTTGVTPRVVAALAATGLQLEVTVVVRPDLADVVREVDPGGTTVVVVDPVADLPGLVVQHDFVISAAGTSVWEFCCLGVPMALVPVVDNQRAGFDRVVRVGAALPLDTLARNNADPADTVRRLQAGIEDLDTRAALSKRASAVVDGLGAWRIVRAWEQLVAAGKTGGADPIDTVGPTHIGVRRAVSDDADELLRWRNDPITRSVSRSSKPVTLAEHLAWLEASLTREDRLVLIATKGSQHLGTVRWDLLEPSSWEVSITLAPEWRGRGLARPMLVAAESRLMKEIPGVSGMVAVVHGSNHSSRRLFEGAGYLLDSPSDPRGFLTYRKSLAPD